MAPPAPKRKRGRPPFVPTKEQRNLCSALAAAGWTQEDIAARFRIKSLATLRKAFKVELKQGAIDVKAQITGTWIQKAMRGDNYCLALYMRTRGGLTEKVNHQFLGKDGQPIDFNQLTPDALGQVLAALRTEAAAREGRSGREGAETGE